MPRAGWRVQLAVGLLAVAVRNVDTLGIEPRAFRMQSGCDTTAPCARVARMCAGLCSQEFARGVCGAGAPRPRSRWTAHTLATANWYRSFLFHRTRCRVPGRALSVREVRSRVPPWAAYFCARSSSLRGTTLGPLARHALLTANHALLARAGAGIGCVCRASHPCGRGNSAISGGALFAS